MATKNPGDRSFPCSFKLGCRSLHQTALLARDLSRRHSDSRPSPSGFGPFHTACARRCLPQLPQVSTMDTDPQRPTGQDGPLSALNAAINDMNLAKDAVGIEPAKAAFGFVGVLLTTIRVRSFPLCANGLRVHMCLGHDNERTGLRRARVELR